MVMHTALVVFVAASVASPAKISRVVTVEPEEEPDVLINPGCGWQKLCTTNPRDEAETMPLVSTYYYRACWTYYEPEREQYEGSPAVRTIERWLQYAAQHNRYVGIRVVPYNSGNPNYQRSGQKVKGHDTPVPAYIFEELGAKGFPEPGGSGGWVPVFWDPIYLQQYEKLIRWLGKKFGDHPSLTYVDLSAGNYGEMNLRNTGIPQLDDLSAWKAHGLTPEAWDAMIKRMIAFYREAFPHVLLVAARDYESYGPGRSLLDHAVASGVGFRDDGLGMAYCREGKRNRTYQDYWTKVPCLYENGYLDWVDWINYGTDPRKCVEWAVDDCHACIVMVGKSQHAERSYARYTDIVEDVGRRLGPRLRVKLAKYRTPAKSRGRFPVGLVWTNSGNSPPYRDFDVEVALMKRGKYYVREVVDAKSARIREWLPGQDVPMKVDLELKGLPSGTYEVRVSLFTPGKADDPRFRYKPAMKGRDRFERALVGEVELSGVVGGGDGSATAAGARKPKADAVQMWDARLRGRLSAAIAGGATLSFYATSLRQRVTVLGIDDAGTLRAKAGPVTMNVEWPRLSFKERAGLSVAVLREGDVEDHLMAAFYFTAAGDAEATREHAGRAGEFAAMLGEFFEAGK